MLAMFFWAFVVGGLICVVGQLLFDVAKLNSRTYFKYICGDWCYT